MAKTVKTNTMENPFVLGAEVSTHNTNSRTIPGAVELISQCNSLALDAIKKATSDPEVGALAAAMQTGGMPELQAFVEATVEVPTPEVIQECSDEELNRMLESRRSDRSKAKKAGLNTLDTIRRYISAWVAELVIREASGKAYKAPTGTQLGEFESTDRDEITRKIKSLQSKKCRLNQAFKTIVAAGIDSPEIKQQLDEVEAEIKRLNAMRGTTVRVKTTDAVPSTEQLRAALAGMSADELKALLEEAAG